MLPHSTLGKIRIVVAKLLKEVCMSPPIEAIYGFENPVQAKKNAKSDKAIELPEEGRAAGKLDQV